MRHIALIGGLLATPAVAVAADIAVVTDMPVTAGLVAAVTEAPAQALVAPGADPHSSAMRPSEARALQDADLLVTVAGATPWLDDSRLSGGARSLALTDASGDVHAWLDPANAAAWLGEIAEVAGEIAPDRADAFRAAAEAGATEIEAVAGEVRARIDAAGAVEMLAAHDAWGSAARAFGLEIAASISDTHNHGPGAGHLNAIEGHAEHADCILLAPSDDRIHAERLAEEHDVPMVEVALIGTEESEGLARYTSILHSLAGAVETCAMASDHGRDHDDHDGEDHADHDHDEDHDDHDH